MNSEKFIQKLNTLNLMMHRAYGDKCIIVYSIDNNVMTFQLGGYAFAEYSTIDGKCVGFLPETFRYILAENSKDDVSINESFFLILDFKNKLSEIAVFAGEE